MKIHAQRTTDERANLEIQSYCNILTGLIKKCCPLLFSWETLARSAIEAVYIAAWLMLIQGVL